MRGEENNIRKKILAAATFIKLTRACESVSARVHTDLEVTGLTFSQFAILEVLYNKGSLRLSEVSGKVLGGTKSSLAEDLAGLEERGLVQRLEASEERDSLGRGGLVLDLTPEGHDLLQGFLPKHLDRIHEEMDALSEEELTTLGDLLRKLGLGGAPASRKWQP